MKKIFLFPTIDLLVLGSFSLVSIIAAIVLLIIHDVWTMGEAVTMGSCCFGFLFVFVAVMISKYRAQPKYQTNNGIYVFHDEGMAIPTQKQIEFATESFRSFMSLTIINPPALDGCKLFFKPNRIPWPFFGDKEGVQWLKEFYVHVQPTVEATLALTLHEAGHYIHGGNTDVSLADPAHANIYFWDRINLCVAMILKNSGWTSCG